MTKKAVVLFSGGLDSTTCLAMAIDQGFEPVPLSFDYHQRHKVELDAARSVLQHYGISKHYIFNVALFKEIGGSALTDANIEVPHHQSLDEVSTGIPSTYVPARNLVFLSYALGVAEQSKAHDIFIGVNAVDYSGYPDCRPEFIEAFRAVANLAVKEGVEGGVFRIHTPLIALTKAQIVQAGSKLDVPYQLTHSCYSPVDGLACGHCDSCLLRRKGFEEAGLPDPTRYSPTTS
ncbi:MAG: 7-cyano-7-deazaguanine synthase QueC [Myxococcota bacterium]|nr:7-cyano-7-deazaguanine synthase QueC [Myxococcota bacterium]